MPAGTSLLTASILLALASGPVTAAEQKNWQCQVSADGQGWDCSQNGDLPPAKTRIFSKPATAVISTTPIAEEKLPVPVSPQPDVSKTTAPEPATVSHEAARFSAATEAPPRKAATVEVVAPQKQTDSLSAPPAVADTRPTASPSASVAEKAIPEQAEIEEAAVLPQQEEKITPLAADASPAATIPASGHNADTVSAVEPSQQALPTPLPTEPAALTTAEPVKADDPAGREATTAVATTDKTIIADNDNTTASKNSNLPARDLQRIERDLSWKYCGKPAHRLRQKPPKKLDEQRRQADIFLEADGADFFPETRTAEFDGNVVVTRADQIVEAAQVNYLDDPQTLDAKGNVFYQQWGSRLLADSAHIDLSRNSGSLNNVEYRLTQDNARGSASHAEIESPAIIHYDDISYTTCAPGSDAWAIKAAKLTTNTDTGVGEAEDARLLLGGVPVAYLPWASFPIDDRRKSGFLVPSLGSSDSNGIDVSTPYYWNIAPEMDATITPRYLDKRGLMLGGEVRYLAEDFYHELNAEILPDDKTHDKTRNNDTRGAFHYKMRGNIQPRLSTFADVEYASDANYLEDLGDSLSVSSRRQLKRQGVLNYAGDDWNLLGNLEYYQTLDKKIPKDSRAYARLPQVLFTLNKRNQAFGLDYSGHAEYTYFDRSSGATGNRVDIKPTVSLPWRNSWSFITPKASVRYTGYSLNDVDPGFDDSSNRLLPTLSLDGGMFFDRKTSWLGSGSTQTLEPRLFYLYTPYTNQDDIPVFDSAELDFSFPQLFRDNRFSGADRVADANQITAAITTRMLDDNSGQEIFHASVGQIYSFRNQRVQLPNQPKVTDSASPIVAELGAHLFSYTSAAANIRWDPNETQTELGAIRLNYRTPDRKILNLSYRYRRDILEQTDVAARWPISRNLYAVGRWNYSLRSDTTLEGFGGLEYDTCCWALRGVGRTYVRDANDDRNNSFMLQLELKGLTSIGDHLDDFLEEGILGYKIPD
ncbi:MAG: LPS assembly protein LptD [gamma proteobacterium symbiont of Bathyaustriella thionipta]|nr:LPS assembly protein LptD [gamma proteobacterium symbiont of Bathyaustriella thionipta]